MRLFRRHLCHGQQPPHEPPQKPQHRVQITQPFYLGVYPVTQAQYQRVMTENPSGFKGLQIGGMTLRSPIGVQNPTKSIARFLLHRTSGKPKVGHLLWCAFWPRRDKQPWCRCSLFGVFGTMPPKGGIAEEKRPLAFAPRSATSRSSPQSAVRLERS